MVADEHRKHNGWTPGDCPIAKEWAGYFIRQQEAQKQIAELHMAAIQFSPYVKHLAKLDRLDDIGDKLLDSATGRKQFDKDAVMLLIKIFGGVIVALVLCIMFLLTGQHFGLLDLVGHK